MPEAPAADVRAAELADALYAKDGTCRKLGISLHSARQGAATVGMRVTEEMTNGHGTGHGGFIFLLADAAFSFACNTHGPVTVAHSAQVTFLRPVAVGDELIAEAAERRRYGRSGIYDVIVRRADGEIVAEFRGQSQMLSGRPFTPDS
ncbi:acyl-CoA thioesterase [Saccharopolyspora kobensis]|uniref:Acyl-CoA thioesterase n=1 Tax=Saccharopolyspora kobensis TaxID=146035 RepID=A0A1H5UX45_9PSEU|nr:hydroxyphenylacetyl-CoA thioesterase PaaI [Saccharopolyspora kobensis]SEF79540.1 acyl-CoA thioesterase [Saccharopolyspora kobensis]SFC67987.1 acyl-CoA thioesterase [Saccharopolyspora kobensis]